MPVSLLASYERGSLIRRAATIRAGLDDDAFRRLSERSYCQAAREGIHRSYQSYRGRTIREIAAGGQINSLTSSRGMADATHVGVHTAPSTILGSVCRK